LSGGRDGQVNAHTHLYSGLVPFGMPPPPREPKSFVEILELVWWRLDRALDEASLRAAARVYIAEALLAGTTTIVDHHESPSFIDGSLDVLAEEAARLGARMLVTYGATERNGGRDEARRGLAECARFIRANRFANVRGLVGLHAPFTVSDETIREAGALCRELGVPMHVHVAEDMADVEDAKRRGYRGPVERLVELDALPKGSVLAHGVWLDESSVRLVAERGAWLVQNPRSNANNRVGYPRALGASPDVALGTDGFPADMEAELRALVEEATKHGDLDVARAPERRCASGARLADSFFPDAGRVASGELVHGDIDAIRAEAREQAARLWTRMAAIR
jgi:cytosine/adenosine deaminase-related metal-dependent hydrolase